ncbi:MAG: hypothetical protein L3J66_11020 [Bacteroidales bacterium]|nr:hypothetical protein [Bacteroidales bacterium]
MFQKTFIGFITIFVKTDLQKVIVNISNPTDFDIFLKMVERLAFVESAKIEGVDYDWINPSRPATGEECEQMIAECESEYLAGSFLTIDEARKLTLDELAKWRIEQEK